MVSHYDAVLAAIPLLSGGGFLVGQLTGLPAAIAGMVASLAVIGHELFNPPAADAELSPDAE
jgi:hypothetical protein